MALALSATWKARLQRLYYRYDLDPALRYIPARRFARGCTTILDVGSGRVGAAGFLRGKSVGVDVKFAAEHHKRLLLVQANGLQLPFLNFQFDCTFCLDVLEHLPLSDREGLVAELVRTARKRLILGAPTGARSRQQDLFLYELHLREFGTIFPSVAEHLRHPEVEAAAVEALIRRFGGPRLASLRIFPSLNLRVQVTYFRLALHLSLFRNALYWAMGLLVRSVPSVTHLMDFGSCYRTFFVAEFR